MSAGLTALVNGVLALQGLARAGIGSDVSPEEAEAVLVKLEHLQAMEQRANAILTQLNRTASAHTVAREILGET